MLFSIDVLVLWLVVIGLIIWGVFALRRWLNIKPAISFPMAPEGSRLQGEVVELLRENGYEVVHGKWKIEMKVYVNEQELSSSMFLDYVAKHGDDYYVVKAARARKPLDVTAGSAVREQLLPYALLYDHAAGVLYVDAEHRKLYKIRFELEL